MPIANASNAISAYRLFPAAGSPVAAARPTAAATKKARWPRCAAKRSPIRPPASPPTRNEPSATSHIAGHVGDEYVPELEIARSVDEPGDDGKEKEQGR